MEEINKLTLSIGHFTDVTRTLGITEDEIIKLLNSGDPCFFKYGVSLGFSIITRLKLNMVNSDEFNINNIHPGVYWFGKIEGGRYRCSPRGYPDMVVKLLPGNSYIVEVTLATTSQQWEREIEPAIRHDGNLGINDILFIVPRVDKSTLDRINYIERPYRMAVIENPFSKNDEAVTNGWFPTSQHSPHIFIFKNIQNSSRYL